MDSCSQGGEDLGFLVRGLSVVGFLSGLLPRRSFPEGGEVLTWVGTERGEIVGFGEGGPSGQMGSGGGPF